MLKKNRYNQVCKEGGSCCICFEEFEFDTEVRVTPCKHIFHGDCIMSWVSNKLPKPDCPNCREEFIKRN
jgi:E3 ubiquitin-protein ligase RNF115/126